MAMWILSSASQEGICVIITMNRVGSCRLLAINSARGSINWIRGEGSLIVLQLMNHRSQCEIRGCGDRRSIYLVAKLAWWLQKSWAGIMFPGMTIKNDREKLRPPLLRFTTLHDLCPIDISVSGCLRDMDMDRHCTDLATPTFKLRSYDVWSSSELKYVSVSHVCSFFPFSIILFIFVLD